MFQPHYENSHALVIGINAYQHEGFSPLGKARTDAEAVAGVLSGNPYHFQVTLLVDEDATRQRILSELHALRNKGLNDRILIYFAGHGYNILDANAHPTGYLAAIDTEPNRDYTAIAISEVTKLTRFAPTKHIGFIFDSCYSRQALKLEVARARNIAVERYLTGQAFQVLTAAERHASDTRSMTSYLLDALRNPQPHPETGMFTFDAVGDYVREQMILATDSIQKPLHGFLTGGDYGEFIFHLETGPRLPADVVQALKSQFASIRLGAVATLTEIADANDELSALAAHTLQELASSDPADSVREAAQSYFSKPILPDTVDNSVQPIEQAEQVPIAKAAMGDDDVASQPKASVEGAKPAWTMPRTSWLVIAIFAGLLVVIGVLLASQASVSPSPEVEELIAEAYNLIEQGDDEQAFELLSQAIELAPRSAAEAHKLRGDIHMARGDLDAAIRDYDAAIELNQDLRLTILAHASRADTLVQQSGGHDFDLLTEAENSINTAFALMTANDGLLLEHEVNYVMAVREFVYSSWP